jgi:hypothetical protein
MEQIAPGLSYWTAYHPEWKEDVVSYALETVVLTLYYHARSTAELSPKRVWAPHRSVRPLEHRGIAVTDPLRPGDEGPGGKAAVRAALTPALELPVERVLVSHGGVALAGDRKALARALRQAPSAA